MERYGPDLIESVEHFFCAGSDLIINYLQKQANGDILPSELLFGLFMSHHMASCFETDDNALAEFYRQTADRFLKGFNADKSLKIDLDAKYRTSSKEVEQVLGFQLVQAGLRTGFKRLLDSVTNIGQKEGQVSPKARVTLLADLIHMQLNRTFKIKHRQQELMVYYFLHKYMTSKTAQLKYKIDAV
jgi:thiopeptide-type bacteriocin biosynthesis protein